MTAPLSGLQTLLGSAPLLGLLLVCLIVVAMRETGR